MLADHYGDHQLRWQLQRYCTRPTRQKRKPFREVLGQQVCPLSGRLCLVGRVQFPPTDPHTLMHTNKGTTGLVRHETECMAHRRHRKFRGQVEPLAETGHAGYGAVEVRNGLS